MGYDFQKMATLINDSGMTKKAFWNQVGLSEKTFASWVNGSVVPKEASVRKIADRLGVSLADLRTRNELDVSSPDPIKEGASVSMVPLPDLTFKGKSDHASSFAFSETELDKYRGCSACIIFDTCSIMNFPDLLEFVNGEELVVVPKVVLNELENNKIKFGHNEAGRKAQNAISAILSYKKQRPMLFADDNISLIPNVYRVEDGKGESNDNKILSVVIRHKLYIPTPVLFITDDYSLSLKASGQEINVCSAQEFKRGDIPPFPHIDWPKEAPKSDPTSQFKKFEENGEYNKAVLYSIILKKVSTVRKQLNGQIDAPIKELAELYISLRTKKDVPQKKRLMFAELKAFAIGYIDEEDMNALTLSFGEAYQDALSSLSGSIKQIAGDL